MLKDYCKASYPLLYVTTIEPRRFVQQELPDLTNLGKKAFWWDLIDGVQPLNHESERSPLDPNEMLKSIRAGVDDGVYFLSNFNHFLKAPDGSLDILNIQEVFNLIPYLKTKRCQLVVLATSLSLPEELEREFTVLDHVMPTQDELVAVVNQMVNDNGLEAPESMEEITAAGRGLTLSEFEDVLALSLVRTKRFSAHTIAEQKAQMVKKTAGLQITKFAETFDDLGGYENLKQWTLNRFNRRKLQLGSDKLPFRGILLLGVPGAGKSMFAKALGHEVTWPCIVLNIGELFGSLVGQSEERARRVFATIDSMAPVIVFLDEIEKGLSGIKSSGSTDSGVTARVGETFLKWMNDHESEVFVIATANNIDNLPPEYLRSGRWDGVFFVDVPSENERLQILDIYLKKFHNMSVSDLSEIPDLTDYTGAEIRQLCIEAAYNGSDFMEAAKYVIPIARARRTELQQLRDWASHNCIPASTEVNIRPIQKGSGTALMQDFVRTVSL